MTNTYSPYALQQSITMFPVHGEEGANIFPVAPGQKVTLIDVDNAVIYVKSTNQFGQSLPLEIYDLVLRKPPVQDIPQATSAMSKDEIINEVNTAVRAAMQKYFPQINFND